MERIERIQSFLNQAFQPTQLDIQDDSHAHAGHRNDGAGHYTVAICSEHFQGRSSVERHRMVYAALKDMMPEEIHALSIHARSPGEGV
jgi:BolA protein